MRLLSTGAYWYQNCTSFCTVFCHAGRCHHVSEWDCPVQWCYSGRDASWHLLCYCLLYRQSLSQTGLQVFLVRCALTITLIDITSFTHNDRKERICFPVLPNQVSPEPVLWSPLAIFPHRLKPFVSPGGRKSAASAVLKSTTPPSPPLPYRLEFGPRTTSIRLTSAGSR